MQVITTLLTVSAAAASMHAFGLLKDTEEQADSLLKGHEFLCPEECHWKGFIILACIFKILSQDSWFQEGVLKLSCYLYFTELYNALTPLFRLVIRF